MTVQGGNYKGSLLCPRHSTVNGKKPVPTESRPADSRPAPEARRLGACLAVHVGVGGCAVAGVWD